MRNAVSIAAALLLTAATPVLAQTATTAPKTTPGQTAATQPAGPDWAALRDARVAIVKAALQLRPDQQQYWPALEAAIRARSEARERRFKQFQARQDSMDMDNPVALVRARADNLAERAQGLKQLADAWQPLYGTLDNDQKRRMLLVTALILREARDAIDAHMMDDDDEAEY